MVNCKAVRLVGFHWLERAGTITLPSGENVRVKKCKECGFRAYTPTLQQLNEKQKQTQQQLI